MTVLVYVVTNRCDSNLVFLSGRAFEQVFFLSFVYICIAVGNQIIKMGKVGVPLNSLCPPHVCACHKPGPGFPTPCVVVVFFSFVDIGGLVDQHCITGHKWRKQFHLNR